MNEYRLKREILDNMNEYRLKREILDNTDARLVILTESLEETALLFGVLNKHGYTTITGGKYDMSNPQRRYPYNSSSGAGYRINVGQYAHGVFYENLADCTIIRVMDAIEREYHIDFRELGI